MLAALLYLSSQPTARHSPKAGTDSCPAAALGKGPALGVSFMVHTGILASQSVFTAHHNGAKEEDASMAIQEWGCSYVLLTPPPGSFPQPLSDAQRPQMLSIVGNTQEKIL